MISAPCKSCDKQGCGPYHDICPAYQEYVRLHEEEKVALKKHYEYCRPPYLSNSTFQSRRSEHTVFKSHMR